MSDLTGGTDRAERRKRYRANRSKHRAGVRAARDQARNMIWLVDCPHCGAKAGEPCLEPDGRIFLQGDHWGQREPWWQAHKKRKVLSGYKDWKQANLPKFN